MLLSKASEDAAGEIWGSRCTSNTLELSSCSCEGNTTQGLTGASSLVGTPRGPSGDEGGGEAAPPRAEDHSRVTEIQLSSPTPAS